MDAEEIDQQRFLIPFLMALTLECGVLFGPTILFTRRRGPGQAHVP